MEHIRPDGRFQG